VNSDYVLEPHQLETLRLTCVALSRMDDAAALVDEQGVQITSRLGEKKENPSCRTELSYLRAVMRGMRELQLDQASDYEEYTRSPRQGERSALKLAQG